MNRKTMPLTCLALCAGAALTLAGCKNNEADAQPSEHPQAEHPQGEHPKAEHPKGEHPSEHPQGEHPRRN